MLLCFAMRGSAHELHKLVEPVLGLDFLDPGYRSILLAAALACLLTLLDRSGITQTTAHLESPTPEFRHGIPVFLQCECGGLQERSHTILPSKTPSSDAYLSSRCCAAVRMLRNSWLRPAPQTCKSQRTFVGRLCPQLSARCWHAQCIRTMTHTG